MRKENESCWSRSSGLRFCKLSEGPQVPPAPGGAARAPGERRHGAARLTTHVLGTGPSSGSCFPSFHGQEFGSFGSPCSQRSLGRVPWTWHKTCAATVQEAPAALEPDIVHLSLASHPCPATGSATDRGIVKTGILWLPGHLGSLCSFNFQHLEALSLLNEHPLQLRRHYR